MEEFGEEYEKIDKHGGYNIFTHALYDALWALAFALNRTMTMVNSDDDINGTGCENAYGSLVPLHEFTYANAMMGCLIQWNLQQTNFLGLTVNLNLYIWSETYVYLLSQGNVRFNNNGTRIHTIVRVLQYQQEGKDYM